LALTVIHREPYILPTDVANAISGASASTSAAVCMAGRRDSGIDSMTKSSSTSSNSSTSTWCIDDDDRSTGASTRSARSAAVQSFVIGLAAAAFDDDEDTVTALGTLFPTVDELVEAATPALTAEAN